jgi:hypothetical protein
MTSLLTPGRRYQVEECLGRPLTSEELVDVASLEELSEAQLAVVNVLAHRPGLAGVLYLEGVVEDVLLRDVRAFVDRIRDTPVRSR